MLYLLYERLADNHHYIPVLNLLRYLTFRSVLSLATAQLTVVAMGSRFIRWMQAKQGRGQPIRKDGIERHIVEKAGTPTMGGLMFLAGIAVGTLLWADLTDVYVWVVLMVTAASHRGDAFAAAEFLMDYLKTRAPFWKQEERPQGTAWVAAKGTDDLAAERWDKPGRRAAE